MGHFVIACHIFSYKNGLPQFFRLMLGFVFLPDLVHGEVVVQPVAAPGANVDQLQGKASRKVPLTRSQATNHQPDYILKTEECNS